MPDLGTDRIALMLDGNVEEKSGAAAIAVERLDRGLSQVEAMMGPIGRATSRFEAALAKEGATAEGVGKAFHGLVGAIQKYNASQVNKAMRNEDLKAAKAFAEAEERKYQNALEAQKKFSAAVQREDKYNLALEKKHQDNQFRMAADADERRYQKALRDQETHNKRMRSGENPFGLSGRTHEPQPKRSFKERVAKGAVQWVGKNFGESGLGAVGKATEMVEKMGPAISRLGPAFASAAAGIAAVGAAAIAGGAYVAKEFGGAVIEAQAYRENVQEAFKIVRRTQGDADKVMAMANSTSDYLGVNRAEGAGQYLDLLTKFGDVGVVDHLQRSLADLTAVDPNAKIGGLVDALGKMQGKGKLTAETLDSLNANGLEQGDVLAQLEKRYGKTREEINKMVSAGKVDATAGREAIEAAISNQTGGGPAGKAAHDKADRNLSKLIERVKSIPSNILFDVEVGSGVEGVKGVLRDILGFFDTEKGKGKEVRQVVGDLFNAMVEGLTGDKVDTSKGITATLDAALKGAKEAVPAVREFASGVREIAGAIGSLAKNSDAKATMAGLQALIGLGTIGFRGLSAFDGVGDKLSQMTNGLSGIGDTIRTKASELFNEAISMGTSIIDGLTQGITSKASAAWNAISGVAGGIVATAKAALDSHSPSRIMIALGEDTTGGLPIGMNRQAPKAFAAANDVAEGVVGAMMRGMNPANENGHVGAIAAPRATTATSSPFATNAPTSSGTTINLTYAPVIHADGGRSEADNRAAAAAAVAGSQEEFDRMFVVAQRRLRAAGGF